MSLRGTLTKPRGIKQTPGGQWAAVPRGTRLSCRILAAVPGPWLSSVTECQAVPTPPSLGLQPDGGAQTSSSPWACFQVLPQRLQGSVTAMPRPGRQPSSPCTEHPTGINSVPELTGLFPSGQEMGSVLRWEVDARQGSTACAGSSSPTSTGHVTRRTTLPRAGSYRTTSSTDVPSKWPLPRPSRERITTDAKVGHQCQGQLAHGRAGHPQPQSPAPALSSH